MDAMQKALIMLIQHPELLACDSCKLPVKECRCSDEERIASGYVTSQTLATEEQLLRERQLVRLMHSQLSAIIKALGHGVCEVAFDELPSRVAMLMDERDRTARECNENAKGWKDVRECLERVAAERDEWKAEAMAGRDRIAWAAAVAERDGADSVCNGLRAELAARRHECAAQTKNALQMRADANLLVPMARATQLWPDEMPACEIVEGGILVDAKTVAFAAQEMMHKVYEQSKTERAALTAITRNQSEKAGEEGICPFGCDAPWIALSALGLWQDETVAAWKP